MLGVGILVWGGGMLLGSNGAGADGTDQSWDRHFPCTGTQSALCSNGNYNAGAVVSGPLPAGFRTRRRYVDGANWRDTKVKYEAARRDAKCGSCAADWRKRHAPR